MKSILMKSVFVGLCIFALASVAAAQAPPPTPTPFNPPPCDFSDQFYQDNGLDLGSGSELNAEKDGRFGTYRLTGPPADASQVNWRNDSTCSTNDPTRRNFRILATTGGNQDDGNSPFTNGKPETVEFISILAFLHDASVFIGNINAVDPERSTNKNYNRTVGFIDGGLDGIQENAGNTISIIQGTSIENKDTEGLNPRDIDLHFIVQSFTAFAGPRQLINGKFVLGPCNDQMESNGTGGVITKQPNPCFPVEDSKDNNGNTISNAATLHLRQDWRFTTNRNAMDLDPFAGLPDIATDQNCINSDTKNDPTGDCVSNGGYRDSPFGYFCDDLLGIWLIRYFWFNTAPGTDTACDNAEKPIGNLNGFSLDKTPIILTESELVTVEGTNSNVIVNGVPVPCAGESSQADTKGATWLVCPAIPDPRDGAIASDAFLDAVQLSPGNYQDQFIFKAFGCLQDSGLFCNGQ
ncbi:MAG TPA: hypothetical protein VI685_11925 [Candidatus Angelobacter sp.]